MERNWASEFKLGKEVKIWNSAIECYELLCAGLNYVFLFPISATKSTSSYQDNGWTWDIRWQYKFCDFRDLTVGIERVWRGVKAKKMKKDHGENCWFEKTITLKKTYRSRGQNWRFLNRNEVSWINALIFNTLTQKGAIVTF